MFILKKTFFIEQPSGSERVGWIARTLPKYALLYFIFIVHTDT